MKVFLFAHSGGNVWEYSRLFENVENAICIPVELPGNVTRFKDDIPESFEQYIDIAYQEIVKKTEFGEGIVLFGHSFGGYLLYDLARRLQPQVKRVIISCSTPFHLFQLPLGVKNYTECFDYPVKPSQKIIDIFNPIIYKKVCLIDAYKEQYKETDKRIVVDIPATLIYGDRDYMTLHIEQWEQYFSPEKCETISFEGGHFYWMESEENKKKICKILEERVL